MRHLKKFNESEYSQTDIIANMTPTKVVEVTEDSIKFDNGIELSSHHEQDCCENHYVDFSYVNISDFDGLEFDLSGEAWFNKIEDYGIELVPVEGWGVRIPGYGSNNGYYSSNLILTLSDGRNFDISECQEISG